MLNVLHKIISSKILIKNFVFTKGQGRCVSYIQGQEPQPKVREYFYFIDHQGMLFLDDARMKNFTSCFKEKKFLKFFYERLRINETNRYSTDFPYVSLCGREINYVRCDDYPFVYTNVIKKDAPGDIKEVFCYGHAGDLLSVNFQPDKIFMSASSGRVYHPAPEKVGGIGLVRSNLAIEMSKYFTFDNGELQPPTHLTWHNTTFLLNTKWYNEAVELNRKQNIFVRDDVIDKKVL